MSKHRNLVLSDTHVGSIWGLWQPLYETKRNNVNVKIPANEIGLYLYKCWTQLTETMATRNIETLFINGDVVDGPLWSAREGQLMTSFMPDQVQCASELYLDLIEKVKPKRVIQIHGTDYHNNRQIDLEKLVSDNIGSEFVGLGPYDFVIGDLKVNIAHGSGGVYWYRGTKMDKILFALNLCKADSALYDSDIVIRSHYHFASYLEYPPNQYIMITPCFQAQTDYMREKDPFKMVPTIGALEFTVDGDRFSHEWYLFDHPPRPPKLITGVSAGEQSKKKRRHLRRW